MFIIILMIIGTIFILHSACIVSGRCSREEEKIKLTRKKEKELPKEN